MNKQTIILLLALFLLLIPTGIVLNAYTIDNFEKMKNEGTVAASVCFLEVEGSTQPTPNPTPIQTSCDKCKGTKKVRSPDNVTDLPCPCGATCKCQPAKAEPPKVLKKRVLLITDPKICSPCKLIEDEVLPALTEKGWEIGDPLLPFAIRGGQIQVLSPDEAEKLGFLTYGTMPVFLLLEDNKEVNRWNGFLNGWGIAHLYEKKTILTTDIVHIPFKAKK